MSQDPKTQARQMALAHGSAREALTKFGRAITPVSRRATTGRHFVPANDHDLTKHTATLSWLDRAGRSHRERHAAWTAREAVRMAYRRARSMRLSGEASTFRIQHHSEALAR